MDTIYIENLVFSGKHGVHDDEHHTPQRFSISVSINTITKKASQTDDVHDVVDYQPIRESIRSIIEGPHINLIETIAERIADTVLTNIRVHGCVVTIKKLDIFNNGIPGITVRRNQKTKYIRHTPLESVLTELGENDIAIRSLVPQKVLEMMKAAALSRPFIEAEKEYGPRNVRQCFTYCRDYAADTLLWEIGKELEFLLTAAEDTCRKPLFKYPLSFTEISSQAYPVSECGISVHRDESRFKNIIAICVIEGEGEFYTQKSRDGKPRIIPILPGDVVFMRAPGFAECDKVPLHGVRRVSSPRLSITYRQEHKTREEFV